VSEKTYKVKLVAIAKDEAAYLPEWVFHHLYFGFDHIEVYTNRLSDNSKQVLDKIQQHTDQVSYKNGDWYDLVEMDSQPHLQRMLYAEAYQRTKDSGDFSHICFLDVDEFWTPLDLSTKLHDFLASMPAHTSISFNWLNVINEQQPFSAIAQQLETEDTINIKSIINLSATLKSVELHLPSFVKDDQFYGNYLSDGQALLTDEQSPQVPLRLFKHKNRQVFILHRMFRSQIEYISLLSRKRASRQDEPFKFNRRGYLKQVRNYRKLDFELAAYQQYDEHRHQFFACVAIEQELAEAKRFVLTRAEQGISLLEKGGEHFPRKFHRKIVRIFSGIDEPRVKAILTSFKPYSEKVEQLVFVWEHVVKLLKGR
jgi:hypothetical protein